MASRAEYDAFLAEVRKLTGIEAIKSDDAGLVTVRVDDKFNVNLQFVEATGKVLFFVELASLPKDTPKSVYRDLLVGGLFGKDTAGGYFALEGETETVVYNYFFDLDMIARDPEDFVSTLEKLLQICDLWLERLMETPVGEAGDDEGHPHRYVGTGVGHAHVSGDFSHDSVLFHP